MGVNPPDELPPLWRPPVWLGVLWGFAEATLFFIIPDVVITWAALGDLRHGARMLVAAVAGALAGSLLMFAFAVHAPEAARATVQAVPFVRAGMLDTVAAAYDEWGAAAAFHAPGNGIPYKAYSVLAPPVMPAATFAVVTVLARIERFLPLALLAALTGLVFRFRLRRYPTATKIVFVILWTVGYALYWTFV